MRGARIIERLTLGALRSVSPRWRARTELFHEPYRSHTPWMSGLGDAARLLHAVVRMVRPGTIVEIGSARGYSTCALALGCAENDHGHVYAIDPHEQNEWTDVGTGGATLEFLTARLRRYALEPYATVIPRRSRDLAETWDRPVDLLFIDGDHTLDGVRLDFEIFERWLHGDSLVLFHDSAWEHHQPWSSYRHESWYRDEMGVPTYLDRLQARGYKSVTLLPVPGLTIMHPSPGGFDFLRRSPHAAPHSVAS